MLTVSYHGKAVSSSDHTGEAIGRGSTSKKHWISILMHNNNSFAYSKDKKHGDHMVAELLTTFGATIPQNYENDSSKS